MTGVLQQITCRYRDVTGMLSEERPTRAKNYAASVCSTANTAGLRQGGYRGTDFGRHELAHAMAFLAGEIAARAQGNSRWQSAVPGSGVQEAREVGPYRPIAGIREHRQLQDAGIRGNDQGDAREKGGQREAVIDRWPDLNLPTGKRRPSAPSTTRRSMRSCANRRTSVGHVHCARHAVRHFAGTAGSIGSMSLSMRPRANSNARLHARQGYFGSRERWAVGDAQCFHQREGTFRGSRHAGGE